MHAFFDKMLSTTLECMHFLKNDSIKPWRFTPFHPNRAMLSSVSNWASAPRLRWRMGWQSPETEASYALSALGYSATSPSYSPSPVAPAPIPRLAKRTDSPVDSPHPLVVRPVPRLVAESVPGPGDSDGYPLVVRPVPRLVESAFGPVDSPPYRGSTLRWGSPGPRQLAPRPATEPSRAVLTRSRAAQAWRDSVRQTRSASKGGAISKRKGSRARADKAALYDIDFFCYESL